MDFVGKRYWFWLISLLVIVPGVAFLIMAPGLNPGIEFTGGSTLTLDFAEPVESSELRDALADQDYEQASVQVTTSAEGEEFFFIRLSEISDEQQNALVENLRTSLSPDGVEVLSFDRISPVIAQETVIYGLYAVLASAVGIFVYLWWAFRNVPNPIRYGAAALLALLHDAVVVVGIFAILGELAGTEVDTMFLIGLLTIIGYSVNDTIVVFDRLRENVLAYPNRRLADNINLSISETMSRSLNTSITVLITLLALFLFGGETIRTFVLVLIIGVVAGTYSSIAIAAPFLAAWEHGGLGRLFRGIRRQEAAAPSTAR